MFGGNTDFIFIASRSIGYRTIDGLMIIDNIKSNRLKIDNCPKGTQFAIFVHYRTISIF